MDSYNGINIRALICTIIIFILISLFSYAALTNVILLTIVGIIWSIIIIIVFFYGLYVFFDEFF